MKKLSILFTILLGVFILSACDSLRVVRGTGNLTEETREVSGFNAVELGGVGTIFIEQGDKETLRIEAEDNLLKFLETEVDGNTLKLSTRKGVNVVPTQGIFYYLTVRDLEKIAVNGLGNIDLNDLFAPRLNLEINGGGQINVKNLETDQLEVHINGLGSIDMGDGQVQQQKIIIDGGGSYDAANMASDSAAVSINGLGSANLWANEQLDVNISGGGTVQYAGKPEVNQTISGLGSVNAIKE